MLRDQSLLRAIVLDYIRLHRYPINWLIRVHAFVWLILTVCMQSAKTLSHATNKPQRVEGWTHTHTHRHTPSRISAFKATQTQNENKLIRN